MGALDSIVRSGKALYAGISSYSPDQTRAAAAILRRLGTPCLIHQPSYNMFNRWIENGLLDALRDEGMGCIAFSPLAQGLLTNRYLDGIPSDSRAAKPHGFLKADQVTDTRIDKVRQLGAIAQNRGQSMVQLALAWVLRHDVMTSALIGASKVAQIEEAVGTLSNVSLSADEIAAIDTILAG
jgi:L-glyceraldehyde 3-phosphate reductase